MDTPSSKNGSYLVIAVGLIAVFALVVGIISLAKVSRLGRQLGDVSVAGLSTRLDAVQDQAKRAADDAKAARNQVSGLATEMGREIGNELASIRTDVRRLDIASKAAAEKLAALDGRGTASTARAAPSNGKDASPDSASNSSASGPAPGTLTEAGEYVIKAGDNLSRIAAQFGVSLAELEAANPGVDPRRLQIGQKIKVPKKAGQ